MDVAQALTNVFETSMTPGLLNLPGPSTLTHEYLLALVSTVTYHPPSRAPIVPKRLAKLITALSNRYIWWPTLSPDEVERRYISDSDVAGDWNQVGVVPTEIEDNAIVYLRRYRTAYVSLWHGLSATLTHSLTGAIQRELRPPRRAASFARGSGECRAPALSLCTF